MKKRLSTIFTLIAIFICSYNVQSIELSDKYSIDIYGGYHSFNDKRELMDRREYGLRFGKFLGDRWQIEASIGLVRTKDDNTRDKENGNTYGLDILYHFKTDNDMLFPYLTLGANGDNIGKSLTGPGAGAGIKFFFNDYLNLRTEIKDVFLFKERNDVIYTIGLEYLFGYEEEKEVEVEQKKPVVQEKPIVLDSDGDKVADYLDKCPGTPAGVSVDGNGCPFDSDKDKVADYLDRCPDTPAGVSVDVNGCPLDSDKDKVADYLDKCPDTPPGATVDKEGCLVSMSLTVNFDSGKHEIRPQNEGDIETLAQFMKKNEMVKIEIQGHTDNVGSPESNRSLSQRRADEVKRILVEKYKISPDRVKTKGYGHDKPLDSNETPEGRLKNRRIEVITLPSK